MKKLFFICFISSWAAFIPSSYAQQDFFYVYQYETPLKGHLELALWNTWFANTSKMTPYFGKTISRDNLVAHSIEAEYGLTDHLALDAYADFYSPKNADFNFVRAHFSALYRFAQRYDWFVNTALYLEYYIPRKQLSNSQELELRLILDKDIEDFRFAVNPSISKYITGDESKDLRPGVSAGLYYRRLFFFQPGLEFYSEFEATQAVLFPTVSLNLGPSINWQLGAGFGLNDKSDKVVFKSILMFDIRAIRPSKW